MADLPFMQFYVADWLKDTRMLSVASKGAWIDTICHLWNSELRGIDSGTITEWARLWAVTEDEAEAILSELGKVAGIRRENGGNNSRPTTITIYSKRMVKDELERERSRNSKRPEAKRDWSFKNQALMKVPEIFPDSSRDIPAEFPEDSRSFPGDISEVIYHSSKKIERSTSGNNTRRRPTLVQAMAAAAQVGVTPEKAEEWWNAREATDWFKGTAGGGQIAIGQNWQADLKTYASHFIKSGPAAHRDVKAQREFSEPQTALPKL